VAAATCSIAESASLDERPAAGSTLIVTDRALL
jgi:hypothetical protein